MLDEDNYKFPQLPILISFKDQYAAALDIIYETVKLHTIKDFETYENILILPDLNDFLKEQTNFIPLPNNKTFLTSINKQDIKNSIQHYYNIIKKHKIDNVTQVSANKCIIDPLGNPVSDISKIKLDVSEVNDELLKTLNRNPNYFYQLSPRKFEEVVAEILSRKGYDVTLTSATRDGGKDIFVARKDDLGSFLYLVECKKFAPNRPVGIDIIQRLYGVVSDERATAGIIVTTSYFTKSVKDFQQKHMFKMALHDFESIKHWLYNVTESYN